MKNTQLLGVFNLLDTAYFAVVAETEGCVPDTSEFVLLPINENDMI